METNHEPSPGAALPTIRLRYAGACTACGSVLARGVTARYDRTTKAVRCVACPSGDRTVEVPIDTGVAGASARREGARRTAKRQERTKERYGERLGGVVLALTSEPPTTRAWTRGAIGEEKLAVALARVPGVVALHDRRVPGTRGNIDHLVIAPAGVFVVDAKHYTGLIRIRDKGGLFRSERRLYVGSRDCSDLADNMGWQVDAVHAALDAAGVPDPAVVPILCFVEGDWPLLFPPDSYKGVRLEGPRSLCKLIGAQDVLDDARIGWLAGLLTTAFPPK